MIEIPKWKDGAIKAPLVLASASPRRAELLRAAGLDFQVIVSPVEEPEEKPADIPTQLWPMCLAYMKGKAVLEKSRASGKARKTKQKAQGTVILAADTIVVNERDGRILNKARDRPHARRMLLSLRGGTHRVITGIALFQGERVRLASDTAVCRVARFPDALLKRYLDSGLWRGKAGAYGIQDAHDPFVHLVSGDITTVIGLPMGLVLRELATFLEG